MAGERFGTAIRDVHRLFDEGTVAGLTDGQLLERFSEARDERAFEAIVTRHGPMVLATCRAVLKDRHASEDAFQSSFASLVRRASSLRDAEALGGWLHRVAYREAIRVGTEAARRRAVERLAPPPSRPDAADLDELRSTVHAELDRLPESLRLPLILCDLQGLTKGEAARQLGRTEASVRGRLERGRALLRSRLARRGLGVPTAWLVGPPPFEIGAARLASAVRAALEAGNTAAPRVAAWIKVAATLAAVGLVGLVGFGTGRPELPERAVSSPPPPPARAALPAPPDEARPTDPVEVVGRVLDPTGRPVAGATVRLQPSPTSLPREPEPTATADREGRFSIRGPRWAFPGREPWWGAQVVASGPGFGPGRAHVGHVVEVPGEVTVRLVEDDVPIEGRVVDLEGRAVAGASIRVADLFISTGPDLSKWLGMARQYGVMGPWEGLNTRDLDYLPGVPGLVATTTPDGRFRLVGVGRERLASLIVSGPSIATSEVFAMTRTGPSIKTADRGMGEPSLIFHAGRFDHVASPTRPIEGIVTDKDTGAPLAGVEIKGMVQDDDSSIPAPGVVATTGPDGQYRLLGLAAAGRYRLFARPSPGQPYIQAALEVDAGSVAPTPFAYKISLKRGVLIRGRVTDKATGLPVSRAVIWPYTFVDNPHVGDYPGYQRSDRHFVRTDADGRYEVATPPGRGLLAVSADFNRYMDAKGFEGIAGYDARQRTFRTYPIIVSTRTHQAIVEVDPRAGEGPTTRDLQVDPGGSMAGTVVDTEGQEVTGLVANHLTPYGNLDPVPQVSSRFEATGIDPERPRRGYFFHEGRKLAGSIVFPGKSTVVTLRPWGVVTGRVVDSNGKPATGYSLLGGIGSVERFDPDRGLIPTNRRIELDPDGRFRIERLVPGLSYTVHASSNLELSGPIFEGVRVEPGEVKDLGDRKITPFRE